MTATPCDLLVHSTSAVLTMAGGPPGPLAGKRQGHAAPVAGGAVACAGGKVLEVGPGDALRRKYAPRRELDARGGCVIPGLVDAHTHLVFAGDRAEEFERRCPGASDREIAARGGGGLSPVAPLRPAPGPAVP